MQWSFRSFLLLALSACLGSVVSGSSIAGSRLLVVSEDDVLKDKLSAFWSDLEDRDYQLDFKSPKNETLDLFEYGERAYDHIILLPPKSKGLGPNLTPQKLLDFVNRKGNIVIALSSEQHTPSAVVSLLLEFDIHLSTDRDSRVVDHFNYDTLSASDKHDVLVLPRPSPLRPDVKNYFGGDGILAVPRAVGQALGNTSPLLAPILRAPVTAYSYSPKDEADAVEDPFATGKQLSLISTMQARNSARVAVIGSVEMLEDEWLDATVKGVDGKEKKTQNREFANQVTAWAFQEIGVLKVGRLVHYLTTPSDRIVNIDRVGELDPKIYRIKNDVTFTIELSEYSFSHLVPFYPPAGDALQLEFTMLSPFHRLPLLPIAETSNSTVYGATFTLPDQHGIFAFNVNYKRTFLTNVEEKRQVTVRHFAHDEWPRSWKISGAWVSISGLWVVVVGWIVFVSLWLYSAPPNKGKEEKKTQ